MSNRPVGSIWESGISIFTPHLRMTTETGGHRSMIVDGLKANGIVAVAVTDTTRSMLIA